MQFDIAELAMHRDALSADFDLACEAVTKQIAIYCQCDQIPDMSAQNQFHDFALVLGGTKYRQWSRQSSFDVEFANGPDFDWNMVCTIDADRHNGVLHE